MRRPEPSALECLLYDLIGAGAFAVILAAAGARRGCRWVKRRVEKWVWKRVR